MDAEEIRLTGLCHQLSIKLMEKLMKDLNVKEFNRAIEVGCGDGRYTIDHLIKKYTSVDMFDINGPVIKMVKKLKKKHKVIQNVE